MYLDGTIKITWQADAEKFDNGCTDTWNYIELLRIAAENIAKQADDQEGTFTHELDGISFTVTWRSVTNKL